MTATASRASWSAPPGGFLFRRQDEWAYFSSASRSECAGPADQCLEQSSSVTLLSTANPGYGATAASWGHDFDQGFRLEPIVEVMSRREASLSAR